MNLCLTSILSGFTALALCIVPQFTVSAAETTVAETTATENTTTTYDHSGDDVSYSFNVIVQDKDTKLPIDGVDVRLEKRFYQDIPDKSHWDCYTGETEILAQWNTSDANPYNSTAYTWTTGESYDVFAVISELPDGYSYYGREIAEYCIMGEDFSEFTEPISIVLNLQKEKYMDMDFPICGTYTETISFVDAATHEPIENLECVLVNIQTGEELFAWNTSELPRAEISGLEYCFSDWHMNAEYKYAVQFKNMPENYVVFYGKSKELVYLVYTVKQFEAGVTSSETEILLENTDPDATQVTYISSQKTDTQTTVTRETTATSLETTETPDTTTMETTSTATATTETTVWADYTSAPESETTATSDSDLPQTGRNNLNQIAVVFGSLMMLCTGAWAVRSTGVIRRKDDKT